MRFPNLCWAGLFLLAVGCGDDGGGKPTGSEGGPCYGNGTCDGDLVCASELCVQLDPCAGETCSGHGTCDATGSAAECTCDMGYHPDGLECVEDVTDPCDGELCSGFGTCIDNGGTVECDCDGGYRAEGLECLLGEHTLSGSFTITDNLTEVNGIPYTHAFDDVVNQVVTFLVRFNVESSTTAEDSMTHNKQLIITTGPLHIEFGGAGVTALDMVAATLEGQSFRLELDANSSALGSAHAMLTGPGTAENYGLELYLQGVTWTLDNLGFPMLSPVSGTSSFILRRYLDSFDMSDYASGQGTCAIQ